MKNEVEQLTLQYGWEALARDIAAVAGRNEPVSLDEIRYEFTNRAILIKTAPLNAFVIGKRLNAVGVEATEIFLSRPLWADVIEELRALHVQRGVVKKLSIFGDPDAMELSRFIGPRKVPVDFLLLGRGVCPRCKKHFLRYGSAATLEIVYNVYCTDACLKAANKPVSERRYKRRNAERARERLAQRADKPCEHCGAIFTPQRASGRFCSTRCRVAGFRKGRA